MFGIKRLERWAEDFDRISLDLAAGAGVGWRTRIGESWVLPRLRRRGDGDCEWWWKLYGRVVEGWQVLVWRVSGVCVDGEWGRGEPYVYEGEAGCANVEDLGIESEVYC